jgi:hypothetical protein
MAIGRVAVVASVSAFGSSLAFAAVRRPAAFATRSGAAELARGHWSVLGRSPLGERANGTLVWTGRQLIEAGGQQLDLDATRAD